MYVSYDTDAGATYLQIDEGSIDSTVHLSDLVMVDVDKHRRPVGVEFVVAPNRITDAMIDRVVDAYPQLRELQDRATWLLAPTY